MQSNIAGMLQDVTRLHPAHFDKQSSEDGNPAATRATPEAVDFNVRGEGWRDTRSAYSSNRTHRQRMCVCVCVTRLQLQSEV